MSDTPRGAGMLVSTQWLAGHLDGAGRDFALIDAGEAVAYRRVHLPGALGVPHPFLKGRANARLVMPAEEFAAIAGGWGVANDTPVVIYDDNASLYSARVWWVFRYYGHRNVRVVDGGFNAWLDEGRPLTAAPGQARPLIFTPHTDPAQVCTLDDLQAAVAGGRAPALWDARSDEEWAGTNDRGNARAGRVPGAKHLEWLRLVEGPPARRFRPLDEIRAALLAAGIDPQAETITYCQGGIRAAFAQFALALLGNEQVRNYDGSMGEWANRADTPLTIEG